MRRSPLNFEQKVASVAVRSARPPESQAEPGTPVISGREDGEPDSQPEQPLKKTVSALTRNIEAVEQLVERTRAKIKKVESLPAHMKDGETAPSLKKALANLLERKEILERLRAKEVQYDDR